jgi:hypothetical protein
MNFRFFVYILAMFCFVSASAFAQPFGAGVVNGTPSRASANSAGNATAYAGNVTELTISGDSITGSWQGYFGNVSGSITLENANGQALYNWTLASPQGEVYSSTNSTIAWGSIQCFNYTANGTLGTGGETAGATNLGGLNLTTLETRFNIDVADADGVNETFYLKNHDQFFTNSLQFSADECQSTRVYGPSGGTDQQFEEVLLYEPTTTSVVFASILEQDLTGFNSGTQDFEMLVLEDGHNGNVAATTYFFFVELD